MIGKKTYRQEYKKKQAGIEWEQAELRIDRDWYEVWRDNGETLEAGKVLRINKL